jgi:hypothetical protein
MAITTSSDRQYALTAEVTVDYDDVTIEVPAAAIALPAGAQIISGYVAVDTNWDDDAAETFTVDIGDDGAQAAADPNRYTATPLSVDGDAGTAQAITASGYVYTEPCNLTVEINASVGASAITQGSLRLVVTYIVSGRGNENQG